MPHVTSPQPWLTIIFAVLTGASHGQLARWSDWSGSSPKFLIKIRNYILASSLTSSTVSYPNSLVKQLEVFLSLPSTISYLQFSPSLLLTILSLSLSLSPKPKVNKSSYFPWGTCLFTHPEMVPTQYTESSKYYARLQTAVSRGLGWLACWLTGLHAAAARKHMLCFSVTLIPVILWTHLSM